MKRALKGAFTLIELLVVIAIIILLVSIVLPMLPGSWFLSKNTICLSNLHNLVIHAQSIVADTGKAPTSENCFNVEPRILLCPFDISGIEQYNLGIRVSSYSCFFDQPDERIMAAKLNILDSFQPQTPIYSDRYTDRPIKHRNAVNWYGQAIKIQTTYR